MEYLIPSIISLNSSKIHLFKNQATCAPGFVPLAQDSDGFCGYTDFGLGNQVELCLTDPAFDPSLLEGLIVNTTIGGPFVTSNCSQSDPFNDCDDTGYLCDVNGAAVDACVTSLECPDGTVIATCGDVSGCLNT